MTLMHARQTVMVVVLSLVVPVKAVAEMEEITVSARKREENLQEVPISITAFSSGQIERLGISGLQDVTKFTSSVILDTGFAPQDTRIVIRGLAPVRGRQNVAVLQDGIDISSQAIQTAGGSLLINPRLFDLERVEVVKGPQNALYGRTAFNGAINYVTRKPTNDPVARVWTDVGSDGQVEGRASVSGPLVNDRLLAEVNLAAWSFDGFYNNSVTGNDAGGNEGHAAAAGFIWMPTDRLSLRLRGEVLNDEFDSYPYRQLAPNASLPVPPSANTCPPSGAGCVLSPAVTDVDVYAGKLPDGDDYDVTLSENPRNGTEYPGTDRDIWRLTLTAEQDLGPAGFMYLGHFAHAEIEEFFDGSRLGSASQLAVGAETIFDNDTDLQSHEFRLSSTAEGRLSWAAGVLLWEEDVEFVDGAFNCLNDNGILPPSPCAGVMSVVGTPASPLNPDDWERKTDHWSVYGLVDWMFADGLQAIFEVRYTDENLKASGPDRRTAGDRIIAEQNPVLNVYPETIPPNDGILKSSISDNFWSPKITLQWSPTDDMMYYASWASATKPAGISQITGGIGGFDPVSSRFEPEEMDVWEAGAKTSWLDDRLTVNSALFYQDYTDKQVSSQRLTAGGFLAPVINNASSAEVWGFELDTVWQPFEFLRLSASYTYLDTEYDEYKELSSGAAPIASAGNCRVITDASGDSVCELDLSGNELEYAPEHALVAGFSIQSGLTRDTDWLLEGDVIYQDERYNERFNLVTLDSFTTLDLRLGVRNDTFEIIGYVDNVFDDDTTKTGVGSIYTPGAAFVGFAQPPATFVLPSSQLVLKPDERSFGVRASFRFDL